VEHNYPSDISREQFERIRSVLEKARKTTKPRTIDLYDVFCGVLYVLKSGCQWRMLPKDFPTWRTCYEYFRKWSEQRGGGRSILEEALKKCGWRGPAKPWSERENQFHHR
jgi:transposase